MMNGIAKKRGNHERHRRFPGVFGPRPDLKDYRRRGAKERAAAYAKLTNSQKIALLDAGGFIAAKQRLRLAKLLEAERLAVVDAAQEKSQKQRKR